MGWMFDAVPPAALLPGKRRGIQCIGGWGGGRARLDGCGKSRPH